tara:strand:- start:1476 stop:1640 length:165 start_codon:yes stop_codon:yes gene_type:complete
MNLNKIKVKKLDEQVLSKSMLKRLSVQLGPKKFKKLYPEYKDKLFNYYYKDLND